MRILLADNECPDMEDALASAGHVVKSVTGQDVDRVVRSAGWEIIVLNMDSSDVRLPLLKRWRRSGVSGRIVVITSRNEAAERVKILDAGADACWSTPFETAVLLARLRAMARRTTLLGEASLVRVGDFQFSPSSRVVQRGGKTIRLTKRENALLDFLVRHRGRTVSRSTLLGSMYGEQNSTKSNVLDVYIRYLRTKIDHGFDVPLILTVWGQGYMFRANAFEDEAVSPRSVMDLHGGRQQRDAVPLELEPSAT